MELQYNISHGTHLQRAGDDDDEVESDASKKMNEIERLKAFAGRFHAEKLSWNKKNKKRYWGGLTGWYGNGWYTDICMMGMGFWVVLLGFWCSRESRETVSEAGFVRGGKWERQ